MSIPLKNKDKKYTYKDYLNWSSDERWELIEGEPIAMSPAPSRIHQKILGALFTILYNYLEGKTCEVYSAPFDVRLSNNLKDLSHDVEDTVVQPDISVICDKSKLDDKGCKGSPDMIVEIVSPSSISIDYIRKLNLYYKHKVREYWIIDPKDKTVMVYLLTENEDYGKPIIYGAKDEIKVCIFEDLVVKLDMIFKD